MSDTTANEVGFGAMSVSEFARFARIGESLAWKEIREKRLAARKLGRRTLILRSDAEAYLRDLPRRVGEAA
jgi:hypothetical protein